MKRFLLASFLFCMGTANATVFSVINTNDAGAGSLRQAIADANADVTEPHIINITVTGIISLNSNLPVINRSVTINGVSVGGTIITGNDAYTIFNFTGTNIKLLNVTVNDLELRNAFTTSAVSGDYGSAIHGRFIGSVSINRCYIHHCSTVVTGNSGFITVHGGAVSLFSNGVCSTTSFFYMRQTTIAYNLLSLTNAGGYAEAYGGGVFAQAFNDTIENSTFYGNKVFSSTAVNASQATATGGGMAFYGCSMSINHSSFVSDTAKAQNTGGGTFQSGAGGISSIKYAIDIRNSLVDLNIADNNPDIGTLSNGLGDIISKGNNVIGNLGGTWSSVQATDTVNTVTGVQPLANNGSLRPTCALISTSAAIDKVATGSLLLTDERNFTRDSKPDAGSYEFNGVVLPLKLLSFNAVSCNKQVCLQWNTASENNTSNFVVQKSNDGLVFNNLTTVNAVGTGDHYYTANDLAPLSGLNFYRLQMNDKDRRFTYSPVVKLNLKDISKLAISPNPASGYFTVSNTNDIKKVMLIQNDGRVMKQWSSLSSNKFSIAGIPAGMYTIKIETGSGISNYRLVISK